MSTGNSFQKATEQLYENIYEIDITHNRGGKRGDRALL